MKIVIEDDAAALSRTTAAVLIGTMLQDRRVNLSLTAGATPVGTYALVTPVLEANPEAYAHVHFYNFDEVPLPGSDRGMTMSALDAQLYGPAAVRTENVHVLEPGSDDAIRADLRAHGGLDLILMGLGADGHFCGNMPGTTRFDADIYSFRIEPHLPWYAGFAASFADPSAVPTEVVTMGAPMVNRARRAVLIVTGEAKAEALAETVTGPVSADVPATILRTHPNLLVIADRAAAAQLAPGSGPDRPWVRR